MKPLRRFIAALAIIIVTAFLSITIGPVFLFALIGGALVFIID